MDMRTMERWGHLVHPNCIWIGILEGAFSGVRHLEVILRAHKAAENESMLPHSGAKRMMLQCALLVLAALCAMAIDLKYNVQPRRAKELKKSAPQRRMDKLA